MNHRTAVIALLIAAAIVLTVTNSHDQTPPTNPTTATVKTVAAAGA